MSFVAAAVIAGGATVGASLINKGSGGVDYATAPQTEQEKKAMAELYGMAMEDFPDIPLRETAQQQPLTQEQILARKTATDMIQPQDFMNMPEVQGIIHEANTAGNLLANRLGRMLKASGNLTSTSGRDVLGRTVTDVSKSLSASLAPFAIEERARRERMIPLLEAFGLSDSEMKRVIEQAGYDAQFQKESTETFLPMTWKKPLLESVIGLQPALQPYIQGEGASAVSEFAPLISPLLNRILNSGGSGGNTNLWAGGNTSPGLNAPTQYGDIFA